MEQKTNTSENIFAWLVQVGSPGDIGNPVTGWSLRNGTERIEILRQDGETDEELERRAATDARKLLGGGRTPILISFSEADLGCL